MPISSKLWACTCKQAMPQHVFGTAKRYDMPNGEHRHASHLFVTSTIGSWGKATLSTETCRYT
eukprot:9495140-Pyramimonas_sp.AAC.1